MGKRSTKHSSRDRKQQKGKHQEDLEALKKRVEDFDLQSCDLVAKFEQLPISDPTLRGLKESAFVSTTDIQKKTIPVALKCSDILAAAKTGSGKTLAFLIPMMENLIKNNWNELDGVGALVIAPTRELAIQIYEVLLKVGKYNSFSCGLVIGGKDFKFESERISRINILIGTPGRLLQHMDQSSALDLSGLQMLILDEADRILDMGFKKTLDNIVTNLPPERQTLLFSATQTSSVDDLARLSLTNPQYINCSSEDEVSTPDSLEQCYITVPLHEKLNVLWSFIKTHLNSKILVFVSSSKQVHFIYETFRKLQPGTSLMKLHGRQKQTSRIEATVKFSHAQHCCLFATDIVARGLDFPAIDWVIQLDCPEDAATYIHRVGRAARFGRSGKSLLMLTPSEEDGFVKRLNSKNVTVNKLNIKGSKKKTISSQLQALCFQKPELKYLGQKAFISYFKSIYIKQDKEVFDIDSFPAEDYAKSLGLPGAPRIKLMEKSSKAQDSEKYLKRAKDMKNSARQLLNMQNKEEGDQKVRTKYDKMFERQNQSVLSKHYLNMTGADNNSDDDEEFMTVKKVDGDIKTEDIPELDNAPTSKRAAKRALSKKASAGTKGLAKKLVFDDEGNTHEIYELQDEDDFHKEGDALTQKEKFIDEESLAMLEADSKDKAVAKEKRQEKRRRRQELERMAQEESDVSEDEESEADIDRDYESDERQEPDRKKARWFENNTVAEDEHDEITEIERPQTLEDLESLTAKLIRG